MVDSGSMAKRLGAKNLEAADKQFVYFAIPICFIFAEIAAILHDTKNCNFAVTFTIDDVPTRWRARVQAELDKEAQDDRHHCIA